MAQTDKTKSSKLKNDLTVSDQKCNEWSTKYHAQKDVEKRLGLRIENLSMDKAALQASLSQANQKCHEWYTKYNILYHAQKDVEKKMTLRIGNLSLDKAALQADLSRANQKCNEWSTKSHARNNVENRLAKEIGNELIEAKRKIIEYEEKVQKNELMENKLIDLNRDIIKLQSKSRNLEKKLTKSDQKCDEWFTKYHDQKEVEKRLALRIENLSQNKATLQADLSLANQNHNAQKDVEKRLALRIENLSLDKATLQDDLYRARTDLYQARTSNEEIQNLLSEQQGQTLILKRSNEDQKIKVNRLRVQLNDLQKRYDADMREAEEKVLCTKCTCSIM